MNVAMSYCLEVAGGLPMGAEMVPVGSAVPNVDVAEDVVMEFGIFCDARN
jgi:hypothetical protein